MTEVVPDGTVEVRHDDTQGPTPETECDCTYVITDFNGPAPGVAYVLAEVKDDNDCNPFCPLFEGHYTFDNCWNNNNDPCVDDHSYTLPTPNNPNPSQHQTGDFNCNISPDTELQIRFGAWEQALPNCNFGGFLNEISITYYISCTQTAIGGSCPGISFVSDPITVTTEDPDVMIELIKEEDCDCKPKRKM